MKLKTISLILGLTASMAVNAQVDFRHITFEEAQKAAKAENKLIFVDFYTQWCGPCKRLAAKVFPTKEVGDYMNKNFICLKLDAEAEGKDLAKKMKVAAYPTLMVFDENGNMTGSFAGLKEGKDFIMAVEACKDPSLKPEVIKERYANGERSPKVVHRYAQNIVDSAHGDYYAAFDKASAIVGEYYDSLSDEDRLKPENSFIYTNYSYDYKSPSFQFMLENLSKFDPSTHEQLKELADGVFFNEAAKYFTQNLLKTEDGRSAYSNFMKQATDLGYASKFGMMPEFTAKREEMNDTDFYAYADANFNRLSDEEKVRFVYGIKNVFQTETPEQKQQIAGFARKYIGTLPTNGLISAAMVIEQLENKGH